MRYMVFDDETQTHKLAKRKASPWHPDNYIVLRGWKVQGDTDCSWTRHDSKTDVTPLHIPDDVNLLVGHNIKFDLLHEMCGPSKEALAAFFRRGGAVWCSQYVEYLLNAQDQKFHMCALDDIVESYGGRKKIDGIKALWEAGVQTSEIDPGLLLDYLVGTQEEGRNSGDIGNSELVYLGQLRAAQELGMLSAIQRRMDGLLCTTEMEFNGLKIDIPRARENLKRLNVRLAAANEELKQYTSQIPDEVGFNWGSNVHKSCIVFGGTIKYQKQDTYLDPNTGELARKKATEDWPLFKGKAIDPARCGMSSVEGTYIVTGKSGTVYTQDTFLSGKRAGEPKFKKVPIQGELKVKYQDFFYKLPGYTTPEPDWKGKLTDGMGRPVYGTGADVIEIITKRDIPFLKALGEYTDLSKEIGTYYVRYDEKKKDYVGMLTCVGKHDHIVHHSLNHVNTVTTRLSSSNPNAQNLPTGGEVKAIFVSRFGEKGRMLEIDYSQLEVVIQGLLSGDKNLIQDLNDRVDFHCKRVAAKFGCTYEEALKWCKDEAFEDFVLWKGRRRGCKEFSFQRAYGAGAPAIALSTGMPVEDIRQMIANEEAMYPGVEDFNTKVANEVNYSAEPFRDGTRGWRVFRKGYWQAPTGCLYSWRSYDAPDYMRAKGVMDTFMPTELKNYPVQGTGGEVVQLTCGLLWRWFTKHNNFDNQAFLVNTVHDCVWADCHEDVVHKVAKGMLNIMQAVPQFLKKFYGIDCPVPFPAEAEYGMNMLDQHHIEV